MCDKIHISAGDHAYHHDHTIISVYHHAQITMPFAYPAHPVSQNLQPHSKAHWDLGQSWGQRASYRFQGSL